MVYQQYILYLQSQVQLIFSVCFFLTIKTRNKARIKQFFYLFNTVHISLNYSRGLVLSSGGEIKLMQKLETPQERKNNGKIEEELFGREVFFSFLLNFFRFGS